MPINREEYDNPEVNSATNPSSYGYHHGPVQNPNLDWVPSSETEHGTCKMNSSAPNAAVSISKINGGVCHIAVNGNQMCGFQSDNSPTYWRHLRNTHPGATQNPSRRNVPQAEISTGENVLKLWVRSKGWRNARFLQEPGRGPVGGLLDTYASEMEALAQEDTDFAWAFGTRFHRSRVDKKAPRFNKRKRGPTPPISPPPSPNRSHRRKRESCKSRRERNGFVYIDE